MENLLLLVVFLVGIVISYIVFYLLNKSKNVPKKQLEDLSARYNDSIGSLKVYEERTSTLATQNSELTDKIDSKEREISQLQSSVAMLDTQHKNSEKKISELSQELSQERENKNTQLTEINNQKQKITELTVNNEHLEKKMEVQKTEIEELQKKAHLEFERIANDLLEKKSSNFTETNKKNIEELLNPFKSDVAEFRKKVEDESKERTTLDVTIKNLIEHTNKISSDANNLTTALRGNPQKRGYWGEVILERILEFSGLTKDVQYVVQPTVKDEDGNNIRPDIIVKLPDDRTIIIDSKVSLIAYEKFITSEDADEQKNLLAEHIKSMYLHINQLSAKRYDNLDTSLDFTMMFVPIEPAYLTALQGDQDLWANAYSKRILLISPTNLIACLKLISDLWRREWQNKNALEIVRAGELLYEKIVGFTETFKDIGDSIGKSQKKYGEALKQLTEGQGNMMGRAIRLKNLGLKSNKKISENLLPSNFDEFENAEIENS
ncbi:MAG: DNA recombination protein RmuC [Bacteroidales bacterium]|nr:DNA recombination protein RmuC [Bacteroidales bacterium]